MYIRGMRRKQGTLIPAEAAILAAGVELHGAIGECRRTLDVIKPAP
jgi:hypothetical protein